MATQTGSYDFLAAKAVQDNLAAKSPYVEQNNTGSDTWTGEAPTLNALEDGQEIVFWHNTNWVGTGYVNTTNYWSQNGSALNLTLADGTETGAVPIWYNGNTRLTSHYQSGSLIQMVYKEGYLHPGYAESHRVARGWYCKANYNTDTLYSRSISGGFYTGANGVLSYGLCMKDADGRWTAIVNNKYSNTTQDKTPYSGGLRLGEVLYCSTWYSNGRVATANTSVSGDLWASNIFDFRFCTNISANSAAGNAMTVRQPVYLVGKVEQDGLFYLDATRWWTQTAPASEDGKVYIYLGTAYSWYQLALADNKVAYIYADGKLKTYEQHLADEAAKVAGNYIVETASNDVWIHSEGHGPNSSGAATTNTYGWRIGSVFELVRAGLSYFKMWVESSVAKVRVGLEDAGHSVFSPDGMEVFDGSTSVAEFGETSHIGTKTTEIVDGVAIAHGSYFEQDYHSIQLKSENDDGEGNQTYFYISDLRDDEGVALVEVSYVLRRASSYIDINSQLLPDDLEDTSNITACYYPDPADVLNYVELESRSIFEDPDTGAMRLNVYPQVPEGARAVLVYHTRSDYAKAYSAGVRYSGAGIGPMSFAEGLWNSASAFAAHAEGLLTSALGNSSHAEGCNTKAYGQHAHAEGYNTLALDYAHSEGSDTSATKQYAHAEGSSTTASGYSSHAEGSSTTASALGTHAEGASTTASGTHAHAEGGSTTASGYESHAEGASTVASGRWSHAGGLGTLAASDAQVAIGKYNVEDANGDYALIIGNGDHQTTTTRSNAVTVGWDGNYLAQAMAGIIQMFAGATAPDGWLICDGQAVSRTTYATLFAAIGTTWGTGDGSTTFNVPDLRGRAPIGAGTGSSLTARTLGGKGGAETVKLTDDQSGLPAHTHGFTNPKIPNHVHTMKHGHGFTQPKVNRAENAAAGSNRYAIQGTNDSVNVSAHSGAVKDFDGNTGNPTSLGSTTGGSVGAVTGGAKDATNAHNNMQPFAVVNFIICTGKTS